MVNKVQRVSILHQAGLPLIAAILTHQPTCKTQRAGCSVRPPPAAPELRGGSGERGHRAVLRLVMGPGGWAPARLRLVLHRSLR